MLVRIAPKDPRISQLSRLSIAATDGALGKPVSAGDGTWVALIPPKDRVGTNTVLFTVADFTAPESVVGSAVLEQRAPYATRLLDRQAAQRPWLLAMTPLACSISPIGEVSFELLVGPEAMGTLSTTPRMARSWWWCR